MAELGQDAPASLRGRRGNGAEQVIAWELLRLLRRDMKQMFAFTSCVVLSAGALGLHAAPADITAFGAKGDGKTQNREAINKAIETVSAAGGGTVEFPAGTWVTGSIQLRSNITLHLDRGAVIEASSEASAYDPPEPNQWDKFQDFGHSHFHNSLIWGEGTGEHRHHRRRAHFGQGLDARRARRRGRQSHRAQALPQRDAARFLDRQRRALRNPGDGSGQSDDRQHHDRYQPRWHRHGLLPQCPHLEFQRQLAQRRCHHPQGNPRSGSGAGQREHHHHELPGQRVRDRLAAGRDLQTHRAAGARPRWPHRAYQDRHRIGRRLP